MSRKTLLKDVAEIQPGFSFRGKIENIEDGEIRVLQIKDIDLDGQILTDDFIRTDYADIKNIYFVRKNDVLFTTRGTNRRAACVLKDLPDTVFVSQISSLRSIKKEIAPQYLAWYLNQKPAQNYFEEYSSGSYIQNIKSSVLMNLEIEIPALATQKKIVEIDRLHQRENELIETIKSKKDQIIEQTLINAVTKNRRNKKIK